MESFPDDLLVGVFPLVFAIDATRLQDSVNPPRNRGSFGRFLDAMVASLMADDDLALGSQDLDKRRSVSLFRPDDEYYSSDDDYTLDDHSPSRKKQPTMNSFSSNIYPPFARRSLAAATRTLSASSTVGSVGTSYAKANVMGQSFFERARIESYGTTHGFPPSKDPEGTKNITYRIQEASKAKDVTKMEELFRKNPLSGILPAGWLEKHVHALPSIILVVCMVMSTAEEQAEYDKQLFKTIEHLSSSLAPKRKCKIHVVGLAEEEVTEEQGEQWCRAILDQVEREDISLVNNNYDDAIRVALLHVSADLDFIDAGLPPGPSLKRLHDLVREASLSYYQTEARRAKEKLARLMMEENSNQKHQQRRETLQPPDQILPLIIRYCIKIAFFYEFQLKHEKSLRFFTEAYRRTCRYYQYLQTRTKEGEDLSPRSKEGSISHSTNVTLDGVEVGLSADTSIAKSTLSKITIPPPPADMLHQCRAVAEWLNLKLLSAGFSSRTEAGFLAASAQWRDHQMTFCSIPLKRNGVNMPEWLEWIFVARQRLVFSQLVERYPLSSCTDLDTDNEEICEFCSPWRSAMAAAEGLLRLARELECAKATLGNINLTSPEEENDLFRDPFIGSLGSDGLGTLLSGECKTNHREKALQLILKTIDLYEEELRRERRGFHATDSFRESSSSRSGARIFYLAGGILLGMKRHEAAVHHLEKATKYARGWRGLELSIRKMLIECYEKHVPSHSDPMADESSQALASMILDSYFNADMTSQDLRRALVQFSSISGGGNLKWYRESFSNEDPDLPFTFEVTFTENIFATIGDTVKSSILIKSNLDYAVHVNSVVLLSLAGELPLSPNDLMRATNASEGSNGGIIIQRKAEITIEARLVLPKDLSIIAADDSGNGGELQGVAGKGSFSKSARPRTAGLTSAGGARLLSANQLPRENKVTQGWSLRFLGGKPLKCDGLRVAFYPVQVGKVSGSNDQVPAIELTINKKKPTTAADIKRTPFEEENYIASAWSRPQSLPLACGPRSLRVLGPRPEMVISNITESLTDGKALEGTVNRIVLKLESGATEQCDDISYKVSCFSVLITTDGTTKRLVSEKDLSSEAETSVDMRNPKYRAPVMLSGNVPVDKSRRTDYGYPLPIGWGLAGSGQSYGGKVRVLKRGDAAYIQLDFFRPSPLVHGGDAEVVDGSLCKTDYYVTISYKKEMPSGDRRSSGRAGRGSQMRVSGTMGRGRGRGDSKRGSVVEEEEIKVVAPDDVSLDYSGTIVWVKPAETSFSPGVSFGQSQDTSLQSKGETGCHGGDNIRPMLAVNGSKVTAKCDLHSGNTSEMLRADIEGIRFHKSNTISKNGMVQEKADRHPGIASISDACRILAPGSTFSIAYSMEVGLSDGGPNPEEDGRVHLGTVQVNWRPFPLNLPAPAVLEGTPKHRDCHGPLRLEYPSTVCFQGPICDVQKAPFRAKLSMVPEIPIVGSPFEVNYVVENLTHFHQVLKLKTTNAMRDDSCLFFSGTANGQFVLGPKEHQVLSYTVIATRPGDIQMTWALEETSGIKPLLYVFP